jgi:glycine oxidase
VKVVIIGAGVAGLGIGWRLLQAGAQVTILDRGLPAQGASWAAAGMLALIAELQEAPAAERELALQSSDLWPGFAAELEQASGLGIGLVQGGALLLSDDAARLDALDGRGQLVDAAGAKTLAPMLAAGVTGGLWVADEARVDNRALGDALTMAFLKAGGTLLAQEAAVTIESHSGATSVMTPYARHYADAVVIAAGAWSGLLGGIPIAPVKGEMIALAPPDGEALPGPVIWGNGVYLVPRETDGERRLLVGASMEEKGFDTRLSPEVRDRLRASAEAVIPALKNWTLTDHWAGLRPKSPDGLPLLGVLRDNIFVAGGQFRNGILLAPVIADAMAGLVLGKNKINPAFDPRRFG